MAGKINKTIRVYQLINPGLYSSNKSILSELIFPSIIMDGKVRVFNVTYSGRISFSDNDALWSKKRKTLASNSDLATKAALEFINVVNQRFKHQRQIPGKIKLPAPFPIASVLTKLDALAVPNKINGDIDHWLCRFGVELFFDDGKEILDRGIKKKVFEKAAVFGAKIDIRIGENNVIVGLNSSWLPIKIDSGIKRPLLPFPSINETEKKPEPRIAYKLDNNSQKFLAPYYLISGDDTPEFIPASDYSIMAEIMQQNTEHGTDLLALIAGGNDKNKFTINWAGWNHSSLFEEGIMQLGKGQLIKNLSPGVYNIILDIKDDITKQIHRFQKTIYAPSTADQKDKKQLVS